MCGFLYLVEWLLNGLFDCLVMVGGVLVFMLALWVCVFGSLVLICFWWVLLIVLFYSFVGSFGFADFISFCIMVCLQVELVSG